MYMSAVCMRRENNIKSKVMNYDLIELAEQKNVLKDIVSDVRHVKSALETIKKDQTKQNKASEDMMTAIKENAENIESNYKLIFAMFFLVVIALAVLAVTLRLCL